ncbi:SDR family NAD(P)-dependent oxidoreductase [Burkholderia territorii]|uniref:SDR family NAD(P)-dependent oxidoreductase n=1 Tax=Burkholderia territorii TaxID=1503055 RepID=UPI0009BD3188|nr:glucose 1-dehydrogenase [Burkholderia territorii]
MNNLCGKVALVTGASKGIGAGIAKELSKAGAAVVVNYASSKTGADSVVDEIVRAGGQAIAIRGDVSKATDVQVVVDAAIAHYGRLDIVVNNAGVYELAPLLDVTERHYHRQFDTNVLGLLLVTQAASKYLEEGGSIINISSLVTRVMPAGSVVYSATKGAVNAITGVLSKELGPRNIRVNTINPGLVEAEGSCALGLIGTDQERIWKSSTPLRRTGQPRDVASICVFLASDDSSWMTGECIYVGGN